MICAESRQYIYNMCRQANILTLRCLKNVTLNARAMNKRMKITIMKMRTTKKYANLKKNSTQDLFLKVSYK